MHKPRPCPKPLIIPVFIPHRGCPHQCVFCNQKTITGSGDSELSIGALRQQIEAYLGYASDRRQLRQISFYGGTFLGLDEDQISRYLDLAADYVKKGHVHSLRCSTRPDTVSERTLSLIKGARFQTIELGVQSMDDGVLAASGRGHTAEDTRGAVALIKQAGYETGLQMMVGLPGDTPETACETARSLAALTPDFVRIYPTLVLKQSPLADRYARGDYRPMSLEDGVALVKSLYRIFEEKHIPVIRMGLQAGEGLDRGDAVLAGPYHPAFGHLVYSALFLDRARTLLEEQSFTHQETVTFRVHPKNISRMRGLKNRNIQTLTQTFNLGGIRVKEDRSLADTALVLDQQRRPRPRGCRA